MELGITKYITLRDITYPTTSYNNQDYHIFNKNEIIYVEESLTSHNIYDVNMKLVSTNLLNIGRILDGLMLYSEYRKLKIKKILNSI